MSWGHTIRLATPAEIACTWCRDGVHHCVAPRCDAVAFYRTRYSYVTGREGRVSFAERLLCETHGRKFAQRYQLEMPRQQEQTNDDQTAR